MKKFLEAFDLTGENPDAVSVATYQSFHGLRILFGAVLLYDAWTSLTLIHKQAMSQFMGLPMSSPILHVTVILLVFLKITIAVSLFANRGVRVTGWLGIAYSIFVAILIEHGGDFGADGTDPGVGLAYLVTFLFVLATEDAKKLPLPKNGMFSLARVAFGILWAYDALYKWQSHFLTHFLEYITSAEQSSTSWQAAYDHFWVVVSTAAGPTYVAVLVALFESAMAYGLLAGHKSLRFFAPIGIGLSLVIWTVPEQFGGPYVTGVSSEPAQLFGTAIVYSLALGFVCVAYNPIEIFTKRDAIRHA